MADIKPLMAVKNKYILRMSKTKIQTLIPGLIKGGEKLTLTEIANRLPETVAERTLRRWLNELVSNGKLSKTGEKRGTRYASNGSQKTYPGFVSQLSGYQQDNALKQIRDLWTHTSTAIEGNTLTLGDTHTLLEEGLTISGKPLKDHQEIIGHARAIDLIYGVLNRPVTVELCFDLHKSVQTEKVFDIDKPYGDWKVELNGTYIVIDEKPVHIEYAHPRYVPTLMQQIIDSLNSEEILDKEQGQRHAAAVYAKYHAAIAHVHPFWDGNGRIARLLSNVPLLKSGLSPLIIPNEQRMEYKRILGKYEIDVGPLTNKTGPWPDETALEEFIEFCLKCYLANKTLFTFLR